MKTLRVFPFSILIFLISCTNTVNEKELAYNQRQEFHDGLKVFCFECEFDDNGEYLDGPFGYINENGDTVIKPSYQNLGVDFHDGLARMKNDDASHSKGDVNDMSSSLLIGFMDIKGNIVIEPQYTPKGTSDFENGYARVTKTNGTSGFIDIQGNWFDKIETFNESEEDYDEHYVTLEDKLSVMRGQWIGKKSGVTVRLNYLVDGPDDELVFTLSYEKGNREVSFHPITSMEVKDISQETIEVPFFLFELKKENGEALSYQETTDYKGLNNTRVTVYNQKTLMVYFKGISQFFNGDESIESVELSK